MTWTVTEDVETYVAAAGHLLLAEPALHTIALTVVEIVRAKPDATRFGWWTDGTGEVTGAVSQTPPYPVLLSVVPDAGVAGLASAWLPHGGSVNGPTAVATQVAAVAAKHAGLGVTLVSAERLHRLGVLAEPDVPGRLRAGDEDDLALLVEWFDAFVEEAAVPAPPDTEAAVQDRLGCGGVWLWEVDGLPVAMAGRTRPAAGVVRLGPVWTPPALRGRGYGGAVTAAVSRQAQTSGARDVVLLTDLTNPTSNALYARLGYEPVTDRAVLSIS